MDCQTFRTRLANIGPDSSQNLHFVLLELCSRPEYVEMIHKEVQSITTLDFEATNSLLILDSFIKEAVRVNPLDESEYIPKATYLGIGFANSSYSVHSAQSSWTVHILQRWASCIHW